MNSAAKVTGLGIGDDAFLVASLIDRCPRAMMLRELVQNAFDAAALAKGAKSVVIDATEIDGVRKLRIWNTGPGMDADALYQMGDLASSIGKIKGLDANFGMGAKVASLPSNHAGVRYRSNRGGRVHEVTLGKRDGIYGRVLRPVGRAGMRPGTQRLADIVDVTDEVVEAGLSLAEDWTEVVLMGMHPEQDTSLSPYDGNPEVPQYWLPHSLYLRYFDIPDGVSLNIAPGFHWFHEPRAFRPLKRRALSDFAGYEAVVCPGGVTIHYLHDPAHPERPWENLSSEGSLQSSASFAGIVWRNEIYDIEQGSAWYYEAPNYGITFAGRHISVLIELADDYPVLPDAYRQFLRYRQGEQAHVRTRDFTALVRANCPPWLARIAHPGTEDRSLTAAMADRLARLAHDLRVDRLSPDQSAGAVTAVAGGEPLAPSSTMRACGIESVPLRDEKDIRDRWLEGRAACFYPQTRQLFVNMTYAALDRFTARLLAEVADPGQHAGLSAVAREMAEIHFSERLMRAVLFAIAKNLEPEIWQSGHIEKAMSPEALSIVGDDLDNQLPLAVEELRRLARQGDQAGIAH